MKFLPHVKGQNTRYLSMIRRLFIHVFRNYRPCSNSVKFPIALKACSLELEQNSNKMTPIIVNYIGTTRKVVFLKDLSNKPYPSPVNLLITSIESQKCYQWKNVNSMKCNFMYLESMYYELETFLEIENFTICWTEWKSVHMHVLWISDTYIEVKKILICAPGKNPLYQKNGLIYISHVWVI